MADDQDPQTKHPRSSPNNEYAQVKAPREVKAPVGGVCSSTPAQLPAPSTTSHARTVGPHCEPVLPAAYEASLVLL